MQPIALDSARTAARTGGVGLYLELAKARLSALVTATTAVGFVMAGAGAIAWGRLAWTVLGTALTAAGAMALNQVWEHARDARMERTRERPIPTGRMSAGRAARLAIASVASGLALLALLANPLTAVLGLSVVAIYVLLYTPLKPRSPLCTLVGAVCGAIPPMMGWAAATGRIGYGAWILAAILFVWQIPHFLALAWLYRGDYERGGFRMLPVVDRSGEMTSQVVLIYILFLLLLGLATALAGLAGRVFLAGSLALGLALLAQGIRLHLRRTEANARLLFLASLVYLTVLLSLMVGDRGPL